MTFTSTQSRPGVSHKFYKNGQLITGAGPGATYTITNAQVSAGATYTSTATIGTAGSSSSNGVKLVVGGEIYLLQCLPVVGFVGQFVVPFYLSQNNSHNSH